ncbi:hypothetical protein HK104_010774 [Borealophlyctis nickersoniae]|nr:hypothetical protein HK104_010774 [Borealophlyctis nickersoniae]
MAVDGRLFCFTCAGRKSRNKKSQQLEDALRESDERGRVIVRCEGEKECWKRMACSLRVAEMKAQEALARLQTMVQVPIPTVQPWTLAASITFTTLAHPEADDQFQSMQNQAARDGDTALTLHLTPSDSDDDGKKKKSKGGRKRRNVNNRLSSNELSSPSLEPMSVQMMEMHASSASGILHQPTPVYPRFYEQSPLLSQVPYPAMYSSSYYGSHTAHTSVNNSVPPLDGMTTVSNPCLPTMAQSTPSSPAVPSRSVRNTTTAQATQTQDESQSSNESDSMESFTELPELDLNHNSLALALDESVPAPSFDSLNNDSDEEVTNTGVNPTTTEAGDQEQAKAATTVAATSSTQSMSNYRYTNAIPRHPPVLRFCRPPSAFNGGMVSANPYYAANYYGMSPSQQQHAQQMEPTYHPRSRFPPYMSPYGTYLHPSFVPPPPPSSYSMAHVPPVAVPMSMVAPQDPHSHSAEEEETAPVVPAPAPKGRKRGPKPKKRVRPEDDEEPARDYRPAKKPRAPRQTEGQTQA